MIWIPLCLMAAALILAHVQAWGVPGTSAGREAPGLVVLFVVSAVWFFVALFWAWDPKPAAAAAKEALVAFTETNPKTFASILAVLGLALGFGGSANIAGRVVEAQMNTDGPLPQLALPGIVAGAGAVLVLAAMLSWPMPG
jgi:hypothetical protein